MSIVNVRAAEERDVDRLLDVFDRVVDEKRWVYAEPGYDRSAYRKRWLGYARAEIPGMLAVAEVDGRVAGAIDTQFHPEYGWVLGMFVDASARGCGAGQALLAAAIDWTRGRGADRLSLLVFPHNERALRLYERNGFVREAYYERDVTRKTGEVWDTMLMVKRLN